MAWLHKLGNRFNTQPPEGGCRRRFIRRRVAMVSTHSRLKAAGLFLRVSFIGCTVSTHSRLKAAGLLNE